MVDHYKLITVTHKNLNVEDLAHFIVRHDNEEQLVSKLNDIKARYGQDEVIYLNTCNRVIFLFHGVKSFDQQHASDLFRWMNPSLAEGKHINIDKVIDYSSGLEAINKIYEVASSIDSLVVGEREIFRQFRTAYTFCKYHNLAGDMMRIIENSTVKAAKGETNRAIGRFLNKHQYNNLVIFNRSLNNAQELSKELSAQAKHLGELEDYAEGFDAIFACTASQDPIITLPLWRQLNPQADSKLVIDLSIPHNVSEEVSELPAVDYISVDSIGLYSKVICKNLVIYMSAARLKEPLVICQLRLERSKIEHSPKYIKNR